VSTPRARRLSDRTDVPCRGRSTERDQRLWFGSPRSGSGGTNNGHTRPVTGGSRDERVVRPAVAGVLTDCVRSAITAPSLHNSQPWRFRIEPPAIRVYADPDRRLPVIDPDCREQLVSVGAAIFTLRLAVRHAGYEVGCELLPDSGDPSLAAIATAGRPLIADETIEALAAAVRYRHTNRGRSRGSLFRPTSSTGCGPPPVTKALN
jgi:hypothetical protein